MPILWCLGFNIYIQKYKGYNLSEEKYYFGIQVWIFCFESKLIHFCIINNTFYLYKLGKIIQINYFLSKSKQSTCYLIAAPSMDKYNFHILLYYFIWISDWTTSKSQIKTQRRIMIGPAAMRMHRHIVIIIRIFPFEVKPNEWRACL